MSKTLDTSVRQAVRALIAATPYLPTDRAWENISFQPAADVSWMVEARLAPLPRKQANMGSTAVTNHVFVEYLYEVQVGAPKEEGPEELEGYSGILLSLLRPGVQFTVETQPVRVTSSARSAIMYPDVYPGHAVIACTFIMSTYALNT